MTPFRSTAGWRTCAAAALLFVVGACASTAGVAVRGASGTTTTAVTPTPVSRGTTPSGTTPSSAAPGTVAAGTPVPPPVCAGTINHLTTPTGAPIITVTTGANSWIANHQVEPLSLAVYADGTALSSLGVGTATEPLPAMTIGFIPTCTLDWAKDEIRQLASVQIGQPDITDQGTTQVVYRSGAAEVKLSAYALGEEEHVMTGKEGRARLITLLAALRAPLAGAAPWTPDRLRVVEVPAPKASAGAALVWPGTVPLEKVLIQVQGRQRCGAVVGATAAAVLRELDDRNVYSRWTDAGRVTGLDIGVLVPGQETCRSS